MDLRMPSEYARVIREMTASLWWRHSCSRLAESPAWQRSLMLCLCSTVFLYTQALHLAVHKVSNESVSVASWKLLWICHILHLTDFISNKVRKRSMSITMGFNSPSAISKSHPSITSCQSQTHLMRTWKDHMRVTGNHMTWTKHQNKRH